MDSIPIQVRNTGNNSGATPDSKSPKPQKKRRFKKVIIAIIVIALLVAGVAAAGKILGVGGSGALIENNKYQAVFLTNGQVYFGKLAEHGDDTYVLTNIFYLQTDTAAQSDNPQKTDEKTTDTSDSVKLIKLGSEVHGPEDKMVVSRDQILFFENLKKDGKVSASIDQYAANK